MDVTKLPTDRLCKFKAIGGLLLVISCLGSIAYAWNSYANEGFTIEEKQGEMEVDRDRLRETLADWKRTIELKQKLRFDIESKKNFGPVEPLTEEEKNKIRENVKSKEQEGALLASPESIIFGMDLMRDMFREMPPVEQMQEWLKGADDAIADYRSQAKDLNELRAKTDKLSKQIFTGKAKLNYKWRVTWVITIGGLALTILGAIVSRSGFREWHAAESAERSAS